MVIPKSLVTATLASPGARNAGADSIVSAVTFSVHEACPHRHAHDLARGSPHSSPDNMSALARARPPPRSARRASPGRFAAANGARRSTRSTARFAFPTRALSHVPEATRDASTSARSARDVIARAESRDARARARRVSVAARTPPLSRSAPRAPRVESPARRGSTRSRCSLAPVVPLRPRKGSFLSVF